jgi:hypothetical protein
VDAFVRGLDMQEEDTQLAVMLQILGQMATLPPKLSD